MREFWIKRIGVSLLASVFAWLLLNLIVVLLAVGFLGPFGLAIRGGEDPPRWFIVAGRIFQVGIAVLALVTGWRWGKRLMPLPETAVEP